MIKVYCLFLAATILIGCGEEEYVYPNIITEMVCLKTNAEGFGTQIVTDEGKVWHLREGNQPNSLTTDSIYRVVCRYAPQTPSEGTSLEATAYSFLSVIAPIPLPTTSFEAIYTDPVSIQSIWRSGDYLNMILNIKIKEKGSKLAFIEDGISTGDDGKQTLSLTLFHNRNNDIEGFDQKYYLSVPLWHYHNILQKGDAIVFNLNTYKEGMTSRIFTY